MPRNEQPGEAGARIHVLVLAERYLPASRSGGPVRTLANLVTRLGDRLQFSIVAGDRDYRDSVPFPGVALDRWIPCAGATCMYLRRRPRHYAALRGALRSRPHDVLYINSLFSRRFSIEPLLMRRLRLLPSVPVVLAPRGELSGAALSLKSAKKRAFLRVARALHLHEGLVWQATNEFEADQIRRRFGPASTVRVAPNLGVPAAAAAPAAAAVDPKRPGSLRLAYLGRIAPMKNLLGALDLLDGLEGDITLDVHGPADDDGYRRRCEARIGRLAPNVRVRLCGAVAPDAVAEALAGHDFFLLPTLGENFGHAILEALTVGCPVIISDRTPWRGLEALGVGWDLPLEEPERWRAVLRSCVAMGADEHRRLSDGARAHGAAAAADPAGEAAVLELFLSAARQGPSYAAAVATGLDPEQLNEDVREFWEAAPCGARHAHDVEGSAAFFAQVAAKRDSLEPFIGRYADFAATHGQRVLEIGIGLGSDLVRFVRAGAQVTGIDLTERSVDLARRRLALEGLEAEVLVADAERLPFPDACFDVVYSWGVLHHTPSGDRAIEEALRVLAPGGRVCVMVYARRSWIAFALWARHALLRGRPWRSLSAVVAQNVESAGTRAYTVRELAERFAGLEDLSIEHVGTSYDRRVAGPVARLTGRRLGWFLVVRGRRPFGGGAAAAQDPRQRR